MKFLIIIPSEHQGTLRDIHSCVLHQTSRHGWNVRGVACLRGVQKRDIVMSGKVGLTPCSNLGEQSVDE